MNEKIKLLCRILIGLMIFPSCSSNDDSNSNITSIIGIWKPVKEVDVCSTGNKETISFTTCAQMTRVTFYLDGDYNETQFRNIDGDCTEFRNEDGTWSLTGDNLSTTLDGEIYNPTFFELENDTFRVGYYNNNVDNSCDGGNLLSHHYTEFSRVE